MGISTAWRGFSTVGVICASKCGFEVNDESKLMSVVSLFVILSVAT
jgi:hypothetical protein